MGDGIIHIRRTQFIKMKQSQNKITCCHDCAPLMPDYPLCRNVSCPCHRQLVHKGIDMDESPDGRTQYCPRCEHPLNLGFEHTCVIPENAHEIGSSGRLPANHSEIRSTLAVKVDKIRKFYQMGYDEAVGTIHTDLIDIADAGEYEDMRREVERYFKKL